MPTPGNQWTADGNIAPFVFVKAAGASADSRVLQASTGDAPVGISQQMQRFAPWGPLQDGFAAVQGEQLRVFTLGEVTWLLLGGTVTRGDTLKPDVNGKGVTTTTDGDWYGARAEQSGTAGQLIRVSVLTGMRGA